MDLGDQRSELLRVRVVSREQDHAAHQRMAQHFALFGVEGCSGNVDHQGPKRHDCFLEASSTAIDST